MTHDVKSTAARLGVSRSLVYELCRLGVMRHTRHGRPGRRGAIRITEEAVAEYLAACERRLSDIDYGVCVGIERSGTPPPSKRSRDSS